MTGRNLLKTLIVMIFFLSSVPVIMAGGLPTVPPLSATWSNPVFISGSYLLNHGAQDSLGSQLVTADWNTGTDNARNLVVSTFAGAHQVVAGNAIYSSSFVQDPPRDTFPAISGNGGRIAYLGYKAEGDTSAIYLIDKTGGNWGTPYLLPEGIVCVDNDLDISADGNTITYSNCPSLFGTMRVYVSRWNGTAWVAPLNVSGVAGGAQPSVSADGKKIAYQNYADVFYTELLPDGTWSVPLNLTRCFFTDFNHYMYYPRISPDGQAIFFWRYRLNGSTVTGKDLFAVRRIGGGWSRPALISGSSIVPTLVNESRPAVNRTGTRVVFNRTIQDPYSGTRLEMTEFINGTWTAPAVLTDAYRADYPSLTADGLKTAFYHATNADAGMAAITFNEAPPNFTYTTTTADIAIAGGVLLSSADQTYSIFSNGVFSREARVTHTVNPWSGLLPPTGSLAPRGSGFDLNAVAVDNGMPLPVESPFAVVVDYHQLNGAALEPTLKLYNWNPAACAWAEMTSTLDMGNDLVTATGVDRLGLFAVLGDTNHLYLPLILR
jgi:hypothetical protein